MCYRQMCNTMCITAHTVLIAYTNMGVYLYRYPMTYNFAYLCIILASDFILSGARK